MADASAAYQLYVGIAIAAETFTAAWCAPVGGRRHLSPATRRRKATRHSSSGSGAPQCRRRRRSSPWKPRAPTGWPWRWPSMRRATGSPWSIPVRPTISPRPNYAVPRPTRWTRGTSPSSRSRCIRHLGHRRRPSTMRCGSGWWRGMACWRCARRRATNATPCCNGRWWSRRSAGTSTSCSPT
jgi:hypothetical protein